MLQAGDRVRHQNVHESFGEGVVLEIDELNNNPRVEWDSHRVTRTTRHLPQTKSHAKLSSLVQVGHYP